MRTLDTAIYQLLEEIVPRRERHRLIIPALRADLTNVLYTIDRITNVHRERARIHVGEVDYELSEYVFPTNMVKVAQAGWIYAASGCVGRREPVFTWEWKEEAGLTLVSPEFMRTFWDDLKIPTTPYREEDFMLKDCSAFVSEIGTLLKFGDQSSIDDRAIQILGVPSPIDEDYLYEYTRYDERSLALWLLGTQSIGEKSEKSTD